MKKLLVLILILMPSVSYGQSDEEYWAKWDSRYPLTDVYRVLEFEKQYADSVERHPSIPPFYARADMYRFEAEYLGEERDLDNSIASSMRTVYKLFIGNPSILNGLFSSEVLVKAGNDTLWMPVQKQILVALKEEAVAGDRLTLYCLFLNEHSEQNGLRNIFLISEFRKKYNILI